jgi:hypothetical protein
MEEIGDDVDRPHSLEIDGAAAADVPAAAETQIPTEVVHPVIRHRLKRLPGPFSFIWFRPYLLICVSSIASILRELLAEGHLTQPKPVESIRDEDYLEYEVHNLDTDEWEVVRYFVPKPDVLPMLEPRQQLYHSPTKRQRAARQVVGDASSRQVAAEARDAAAEVYLESLSHGTRVVHVGCVRTLDGCISHP